MKREKVQGQEHILAEHLDGLKKNSFYDFDKPCKCANQKGKIESNEQSKEEGQSSRFVQKGWRPDRVESLRKVNVGKNHTKIWPGFVKTIRNGLRNQHNLI